MKLSTDSGLYQVSWTYTPVYSKELKTTRTSSQCIITTPAGIQLTGTVRTHSTDGFNKKLGRKLAFQKAVAGITSKLERKKLWGEYFKAIATKVPLVIIENPCDGVANFIKAFACMEEIGGQQIFTINGNKMLIVSTKQEKELSTLQATT